MAVVAAGRCVLATFSLRWSSTRTWWTSSTLSRHYATANPTWWSPWWDTVQINRDEFYGNYSIILMSLVFQCLAISFLLRTSIDSATTLSLSTWTALKGDSNYMLTTAAATQTLVIWFMATLWPLYFNVWTCGLKRILKEGEEKTGPPLTFNVQPWFSPRRWRSSLLIFLCFSLSFLPLGLKLFLC